MENKETIKANPDTRRKQTRTMRKRVIHRQTLAALLCSTSLLCSIAGMTHYALAADQRTENLVTAAEIGLIEDVRLALESGVDPNSRTDSGWTALMQASMNGHTDIVKLLISQGADVTIKGDAGWEALMLAAQFGHLKIVHLLIRQKADVNAVSRNGSTALMFAASNAHLNVVRVLLKQKATIDAKDYLGRTPFCLPHPKAMCAWSSSS